MSRRGTPGLWGVLIGVILFLNLSLGVQAADRVQPVDGVVTVVIDPGHGGKNNGTNSGHTLEKEMTLITAQAMYDELTQFDNVQVYMTRTKDVGLELYERAEYAQSVNADFMFSIHYNASEFHTMYGTEVWVSCMPPYNAYGYQFGYQHLESFREMGLFVRGAKTRFSTEHPGQDYYGILRESADREVPAVIIEHCYVDEERDADFVKNAEDYKAFGRADAHSVARYFGLKSAKLGIDYSDVPANLQPASADAVVQSTLQDLTVPDICDISLLECDYDTGALSLSISATDYDSPLVYYDYTIDGGKTWSRLETWPDTDTLTGEYPDTFRLNLTIPGGRRPQIQVRAYNISDVFKESNTLSFDQTFSKRTGGDDQLTASAQVERKEQEAVPATEPLEHKHESIGTTTFEPVSAEVEKDPSAVNILTFLKFCLALVIVLFVIVLTAQIVNYNRRKKRKRR